MQEAEPPAKKVVRVQWACCRQTIRHPNHRELPPARGRAGMRVEKLLVPSVHAELELEPIPQAEKACRERMAQEELPLSGLPQ